MPILRRKPFDPNTTLASAAFREATRTRLERDYANLTKANKDAVDFAFDESKASYDLTRERFKTLDGKGGTLTGIVTTGLGAIAVLGDPSKIPAHGFWLYLSLAAFCVALVAAVFSLAPRGVANPDLSPYVSPPTLANPDNLARVKTELARAWLRDAATVEHANREKSRRLRIATGTLVIGVAALVANYAFAKPEEKPVPTLRIIVAASPSAEPLQTRPRVPVKIHKEREAHVTR